MINFSVFALLFFLSFSLSAQIIKFEYEGINKKFDKEMVFSPEGFVMKMGSFDVFYSKKLDKSFFFKDSYIAEVLPKEKIKQTKVNGLDKKLGCSLVIEKSSEKLVSQFCVSSLDEKTLKYIDGKYSISNYLQTYLGKTIGIGISLSGNMIPIVISTLERESGKLMNSEKLRRVSAPDSDPLINQIKDLGVVKNTCKTFYECFQNARRKK